MAILKGFPPSNMLFNSVPRHTCELCLKDFYCSHPLSLSLKVGGWDHYYILPCQDCWQQDQGCQYWGTDLNQWGDRWTYYSKAREGMTSHQITNTPDNKEPSDKVRVYEKNVQGDPLEYYYARCKYELEYDYWGTFKNHPGKDFIMLVNQRMADFFLNSQYFKFGAFRRDGWNWRIQVEDIIPDSVSSMYFIEDKTLKLCT